MHKVIFWFRHDLRLTDNPALLAAGQKGVVYPIYIHNVINSGHHDLGAASKWWVHQALASLNKDLEGRLQFFQGDPLEIIPKLIAELEITGVYWNRCYEPLQIKRDKQLKEKLANSNIGVINDNSALLWEPWEVLKDNGQPYKVFTPFYQRGCLKRLPPRQLVTDKKITVAKKRSQDACVLDALGFLPSYPWHQTLERHWQISEQAAKKQLENFINCALYDYQQGRDYPGLNKTSRLSPYLHHGLISPHQIWYAAKEQLPEGEENLSCFLSELGWREFSYNQLYHFPDLPNKNWREQFNRFPWKQDKMLLLAWQQGQTGYPFVDAGMRELWQTGTMHNRVRMVVASFLVKNCLIDWRLGASWFWDCLVDADLAINSASWQWVAGSGADAAPYFRIFNPVTQGQKFDASGDYIRRFVPELAGLSAKDIHQPCLAKAEHLAQAGVLLGENYPRPILDLKATRERALAAYASCRR